MSTATRTTVEDLKKQILFKQMYFRNGQSSDASVINFADNSLGDADIAKLVEASQRATFGRGGEDVFDESYRKAWKMDNSQFAPQFDVIHSGVMDIIHEQLLHYEKGGVKLDPRLYKLNVYGPGSFFKPHVDTPRGNDLFATLVVVFPTVHSGGNLLLGKEGKLLNFDSSNLVFHPETKAPQIAFAAFYSDIEHEVAPVEKGYRVTLTYNLHLVKTNLEDPKPVPAKPLEELVATVTKLMLDHEVLPNGGVLGFGLLHKYPVDTKKIGLLKFGGALKGNDALIKTACLQLKLHTSVQVVYQGEEEDYIMDRFSGDTIGDYEEIMSVDEILRDFGAKRVCGPSYQSNSGRSLPVLWVTPRMKMMTTDAAFGSGAFGNEFALEHVYGDLVLTAELKPLQDRVASLVDAFPHLKEEYSRLLEEISGSSGEDDEEEEEEEEEEYSDMSY
ncbi:hypothetical protein EST38_g1746 [Candolleomyces aberdarensis]|uniref:Fe2OG dioxygenase domain-containing protein n=1 Tax=Candolleomyces aberdarensis TaxID=2316362 RepID=A0A4V1Q523_9AGAR|nr:hypothetical protein EST38_g1746 [Candolleomyces aberdarensis]